MNDFTKDELEILFLELTIAIRKWGDDPEFYAYPKLKNKVQSMIDNKNKPNFVAIQTSFENIEANGLDYYLTPSLARLKKVANSEIRDNLVCSENPEMQIKLSLSISPVDKPKESKS